MLEELLYYIEGLDDSIIKLNAYIKDTDLEFVPFTLEQFEKKYKEKFRKLIPENHPLGFQGSLLHLFRCFNREEIQKNGYGIFLNDKRKRFLEDKVDDRVSKLIAKLKLFKSGHIKLICAFEFPLESESEFVGPVIYASPSKEIKNTYSLGDKD